MPTYEYVATELAGAQAIITSLPLVDVTYGVVLNGAGPLTGKVKLTALPGGSTDAAVRERNRILKDATEPARRAVYVLRDGIVTGAYAIWTRSYDPATETITVGGVELWSLLRYRRITWEALFTASDQLDIVRSLITTATAVAGGDLGLTLDAETSGVTRARSYFDYEAKPVAEAVEQLAAVINGFDFTLTASLAGGSFTRTLELDFPRRGRTAAHSGHVFEWGRNIMAGGLQWDEDGSRCANSVIGLGMGEGLGKIRTRVTDTSAFAEGYPLLEDSISHSDVEVLATLDGLARAELAQRSRPVKLPKVIVRGDSDPPLGSYLVGDDCHLVVPADSDPYWPDGLDEPHRIHAYEVKPPNDGAGGIETVTLTLGEATAGV